MGRGCARVVWAILLATLTLGAVGDLETAYKLLRERLEEQLQLIKDKLEAAYATSRPVGSSIH